MTSKDVAVSEPMSALEEFRAAMGDGVIPGLEDVRQEDLTIPVIQIDHTNGVFVDKLTGEKKDKVDGVILGLLKSRVMWPPQQSAPGQKPQPLCRSREAVTGIPTDTFPWKDWQKGKDKNKDWSPEALASPEIACATCYFAQWGSDPKTDGPRCTLQYVLPIIDGHGSKPDDWHLAGLLTVQRTGIKPTNAYISGFVRDKMPLFAHRTEITLNVNKNGTVTYAVPKFTRGDSTPADVKLWQEWARVYGQVKTSTQGRDVSDSVVAKSTSTDGDPF